RCNGEKPCVRCGNKNIQCEYTFKKRCGPKRRKNLPPDNPGLLAPYPACAGKLLGFDDLLRGAPTALNKDEVECVNVFMQNVNSFLPLTTMDAVKRAATAAAPYGGDGRGAEGSGDDCSGGDTQDEEHNQMHHARKAMFHGAIALGAQLLEKDEASMPHSCIAREEIKECFDAALPELVAAHLVLALYWTLHMDSTKITRYIGLAHQSKDIIGDPPGALEASLTFVSVMLYDAKVVSSIGCRVEPPGSANKAGIPSAKNPAACQARVLNILSYVLLAIHNHSSGRGSSSPLVAAGGRRGPGTSTGEWNPKALTEHVYEAKALIDEGAVGGGPNDISRCIVVVLQAYFLLLTDSRRQAIVITEPLADLVADNPLVLHLPIVWSMVGCVRLLLDQANRAIAVERLQSAMEPLAAHLGFSTDASLVEQELMRVFEGKPMAATKRRGATTAPSAAGAAAAAAATAAAAASAAAVAAATVEPEDLAVSADVLMRNSRAQTSSLNVTAQDYSHRGRSPIDMLALEPSSAPQRRPLPQSTARKQGVSRGGVGVSPSLLSAAMASSGEPLLASSPPPSRVGALTRAPAKRGALLSASAPFAPVKPHSALPLEIPFIGGRFAEEAFAAGDGGVVSSSRVKEEQMVVHAEAGTGGGGGPAREREGDALLAAGEGGGGGDKEVEGDRLQLMRKQRAQQASFTPDAPVLALEGMAAELEDEEDEGGRQQSFKADAPLSQEDGVKLEGGRMELMEKQQVQQSFVADAPVSLEQVESNMARLGVSHLGSSSSQDEDTTGLSRLVTSMDLDAAAELLATRQTNFIS
ncbi:unnamed protein product, partial [Hapterophycus canaliculatus]